MRKILLASVAAAALSAGTGFAADLPARGPAAAPAPVFVSAMNWSGFYVGAVAGYGWSKSEYCDGGAAPPCQPGFVRHNTKGGAFGATLGYNLQFGNVVLGVEGDYSFANIKGSANDAPFPFGCGPTSVCFTEFNSIGTLRARAGYAFDRFLPYITGGIAVIRWESGETSPSPNNNSGNKTHLVLGAGLEYAFTNNLSAKVEYLHIFKSGSYFYDPLLACGAPGCFSKSDDIGLVRVGLNYRFGGSAAPVVAKY